MKDEGSKKTGPTHDQESVDWREDGIQKKCFEKPGWSSKNRKRVKRPCALLGKGGRGQHRYHNGHDHGFQNRTTKGTPQRARSERKNCKKKPHTPITQENAPEIGQSGDPEQEAVPTGEKKNKKKT